MKPPTRKADRPDWTHWNMLQGKIIQRTMTGSPGVPALIVDLQTIEQRHPTWEMDPQVRTIILLEEDA
jgi:hypothetical protein